MGLMLARTGHALSGTGPRIALSSVVAAAGTAATVLGGQYAYGAATGPQSRPDAVNHVFGIGGPTVGGIGAVVAGFWAYETNRPASPVLTKLAGLSIGTAVGAYLIAPGLRRAMAEG